MNKNILSLMIAVITLFMISACSNSDNSSITGGVVDNSTNTEGSGDNSSDTGEKPAIKQVTVWFDTQQSSIANWYKTIDSGSLLSKPEDLVLDNYTFLGWYDSNVNGKLWDFNTPVIKDMTLYAMWEKIETGGGSDNGTTPEQPAVYEITYDNAGIGESVPPVKLQSGTILYDSYLPELYADGYIFQGWYYNNIKINSGEFKITENITLTAKWLKQEINDTTAPAEVTNLQAKLENNQVVLTWINPADEDFNTVIIMYNKSNSSNSYGGHKSSGAGNPDSYTIQSLYQPERYTFTIQSVDFTGNKSNGVSVNLDGSIIEPEP